MLQPGAAPTRAKLKVDITEQSIQTVSPIYNVSLSVWKLLFVQGIVSYDSSGLQLTYRSEADHEVTTAIYRKEKDLSSTGERR